MSCEAREINFVFKCVGFENVCSHVTIVWEVEWVDICTQYTITCIV